jgi:hypothetical protein
MTEASWHDPEIRELERPRRQFTIVHPLVLSFFSADLYRDAASSWRGASFAHLFILSLLSCIPFLFRFQAGIDEFVEADLPEIIDQVPDITVADGEARVDAAQPYFIEDPDSGETLFILDTTGEITSLEGTGAKGLLTRDRFLLEQGDLEPRTYYLAQMDAVELNREVLYDWTEMGRKWLVPFVSPFVLGFTYAVGTILILVYGGIGNLFCNATRITLPYPALVSLAAMALTPAWLIGIGLGILRIEVPFWWLVSFLISMSFLYLGVRANAPGPGGEPEPFRPA